LAYVDVHEEILHVFCSDVWKLRLVMPPPPTF